MANYPTSTSSSGFAQLEGSTMEWVDDAVRDRSVNGGVKVRAFFTAKKRTWSLRHRLTSAEHATLETFYDTNRLLVIGFTWSGDGVTYANCLFGAPPTFSFDGALVEAQVMIWQQ